MYRILAYLLLFVFLWRFIEGSVYYDSFYMYVLNDTQVAEYTSNGTISNCTTVVETCNSTEGRRIDGTCNNLDHPSAGATRTPYYRVLDAEYYVVNGTDWRPRLAKSGNELPLARTVRTGLVGQASVPDVNLTHLGPHFLVFFATDITNTRDTTNYVTWRPWCCTESGKSDSMCAPNYVADDDPVLRYTDVRCLNMTKPFTYQSSGCLPNTTTPMRIVDATPLFDLSPVYGNVVEGARRSNVSGMLAVDTINNRTFPPTNGSSLLLGINFFGIVFFWRYHNYIATQLAEINTCWSDDQLYNTTRDINIALGIQMYYYELMPIMMGKCNLENDGVISTDCGFRDVYNSSILPQVSLEYPVVLRWLHLMQDGGLRLYNTSGYYDSVYPIVNLTSNINYIKEDDNMASIVQGCFRQGAGNTRDSNADPDIVNRGLGSLQRVNDIMTNDLAKNRYYGFQSYIKYLEYCFGANITSFDNLTTYTYDYAIEQLKSVYEDVADIDLLAGLWAERLLTGTYVTPTFYCLVSKQMLRNVQADRHWYERDSRPNAFNSTQLAEIRKATAARMMCDIGDSVTEIQPEAFKMISNDNPLTSCDDITTIDYSVWKDSSCS